MLTIKSLVSKLAEKYHSPFGRICIVSVTIAALVIIMFVLLNNRPLHVVTSRILPDNHYICASHKYGYPWLEVESNDMLGQKVNGFYWLNNEGKPDGNFIPYSIPSMLTTNISGTIAVTCSKQALSYIPRGHGNVKISTNSIATEDIYPPVVTEDGMLYNYTKDIYNIINNTKMILPHGWEIDPICPVISTVKGCLLLHRIHSGIPGEFMFYNMLTKECIWRYQSLSSGSSLLPGIVFKSGSRYILVLQREAAIFDGRKYICTFDSVIRKKVGAINKHIEIPGATWYFGDDGTVWATGEDNVAIILWKNNTPAIRNIPYLSTKRDIGVAVWNDGAFIAQVFDEYVYRNRYRLTAGNRLEFSRYLCDYNNVRLYVNSKLSYVKQINYNDNILAEYPPTNYIIAFSSDGKYLVIGRPLSADKCYKHIVLKLNLL